MLEHEYRRFFVSPAREIKRRREFVSLRFPSRARPDNDEIPSIAVLTNSFTTKFGPGGGFPHPLSLTVSDPFSSPGRQGNVAAGANLGARGETSMRIVVDLNRCEGYAQCCFLAPEAFQLAGEEALRYDPGPDDALRQKILQAAAACPVQAILVDELEASAGGKSP
jgi:ferredoxin